jgi:hypothetical protein
MRKVIFCPSLLAWTVTQEGALDSNQFEQDVELKPIALFTVGHAKDQIARDVMFCAEEVVDYPSPTGLKHTFFL